MTAIALDSIVESLEAALPESEPFAAVPLFLAQIPWLDPEAGVGLTDRLTTSAHPTTWLVDDDQLDQWPAPVAARVMEAVRALPPGDTRTEGLMRAARRLTPAEQQEALSALLDGSFEDVVRTAHSKPMTRRDLVVSFVRTLSDEQQEAWIRAEAGRHDDPLFGELGARKELARLDDAFLRRVWAQVLETSGGRVSLDFYDLVHELPSDLRAEALSTIRSCPRQSSRLFHLCELDDDLTDAERLELVQIPWNEHTRDDPRTIASQHLPHVSHHLSKVAPSVRRQWLDRVLAFDDAYPRQLGLIAMLPALVGEDRDRAIVGIRCTVEEEGCFHVAEDHWALIPDDKLADYVARLRGELHRWHRRELLQHIWRERSKGTSDALFGVALEGLDALPGDTRIEIVAESSPWLADRTSGVAPRRIAQLPVPRSEEAPDALYDIGRARQTSFVTDAEEESFP